MVMSVVEIYRKQQRNLLVIFGMVKWPIVILIVTVCMGTMLIYASGQGGDSLIVTIYRSLTLLTFGDWEGFRDGNWIIRLLYILNPILGIVGGVGFLNEVVLSVFSKKNRTPIWEEAMAATVERPIIVCGLGSIGCQVVRRLIEDGYRWRVVIVHIDTSRPEIEEFRRAGIPVIIGDMSSPSVLLRANISRASAILLTTEKDDLHYSTLFHIKELATDHQSLHVIFNVYDSRVSKIIQRIKDDDKDNLHWHPVNLSAHLASEFHDRISKYLDGSRSVKISVCGLGRVGFEVVNLILHDPSKRIPMKIDLNDITIVDLDLSERNPYANREPVSLIPACNRKTMDVVEFYSDIQNIHELHSDTIFINIVTTGDDLSNLMFDNHCDSDSLVFVRAKSKLHGHYRKAEDQKVLDRWINTTDMAAGKIMAIFKTVTSGQF